MLNADFTVLSPEVQEELRHYFHETEGWLSALLQQGYPLNSLSADLEAKGLIALLQGAQLIARTYEDSTKAFDQLVHPLLKSKFPEQ
jgi:TetR/AcrR family transcriptional regulator, transcriptional repressor for nem operon